MTTLQSAALGALILLGGCSSLPFAGGEEAPARPACAAQSVTVYFQPDSEALPATAQPIVRQAVEIVEACRAQGGDLVMATIHAFPDEGETGEQAERAAVSRAETVLRGLIEAGMPADRVRGIYAPNAPENAPDQVMRRRADIALEMR
ncbi:MAG: hypothetical protein AB7J28_02630 [Hyphomonadaceae bacterium]